jgi:electron transfer flavoprotein alpha subunit
MSETKNVLVIGAIREGRLSEQTKQLLFVGKTVCKELDKKLDLVFVDTKAVAESNMGYGYGADNVYTASHPLLENYMADSYLQAMDQIVSKLDPRIILFAHDERGMELAPRLAFRRQAGVTLDCVKLEINAQKSGLDYIKPVLGGKAYGRYRCPDNRLEIASLREGAYEPGEYDSSIQKEVIEIELSLDTTKIRTTFIKKEKDESLALALKLTSANIVVSAGRGLKKQEGMETIQKMADLLGGAVSGSRPVVDNNWLPYSLQIGLTGKKVSPHVYFAVGISGAIQHMAGCLKAKTIVAINTDESAPVFRISHIGVIGDFSGVINGFIKEWSSSKQT